MRYFWQRDYGMPILCVDPMPELGPYFNQRALFKDGFPRPIRWMPTNWVFVPIILAIGFAKAAFEALREAGKRP